MDAALNKEQRDVVDAVMRRENVHLSGNAGTGKSFVIKSILSEFNKAGLDIVLCAPTGVSANNINGITVHRAFGLSSEPCVDLKKKQVKVHMVNTLKDADAVLIDEIGMVRVDLFDAVIRSIRKTERMMDHKIQLIVVGDFFQIPPVVTDTDRESLENVYGGIGRGYAFQSKYWDTCNFSYHRLTNVMRQQDQEYVRNLELAKIGDCSCLEYFNRFYSPFSGLEEGIRLMGKRKDVNRINEECLRSLPGDGYKFAPYVSIPSEDGKPVPLPEPVLLKNSCPILFMQNDRKNTPPLYSNGDVGHVIQILFPRPHDKNRDVKVWVENHDKRFQLEYEEVKLFDIRTVSGTNHLERYEYAAYMALPVIPAFARTIHKSQGQTYDSVILNPYAWDAGILYTGLSRVRDPKGLHLTEPIRPEYLIAAPEVIAFDKKIEAEITARKEREAKGKQKTYPATKIGGHPVRYPNKSKNIKVPNEIANTLVNYLDWAFPRDGSHPDYLSIEEMSSFLRSFDSVSDPKNTGTQDRKGHPTQYPTGVKQIQVPTELAELLKGYLKKAFPRNMNPSAKLVNKFLSIVPSFIGGTVSQR